MIKALIFDLDGTLIQTEVLKASSYAQAISQLSNDKIREQEVLDIFQKYVGLSRPEVVAGLRGEFNEMLKTRIGDGRITSKLRRKDNIMPDY